VADLFSQKAREKGLLNYLLLTPFATKKQNLGAALYCPCTPLAGAVVSGGLGPAGLGRSSHARSVGGLASPAWAEFGQIPTGRKSCTGGWISGPFLGLENVPHITMKNIKRKAKA